MVPNKNKLKGTFPKFTNLKHYLVFLFLSIYKIQHCVKLTSSEHNSNKNKCDQIQQSAPGEEKRNIQIFRISKYLIIFLKLFQKYFCKHDQLICVFPGLASEWECSFLG